jgi:general secretion pathway protein K
MIRVLRNLLIKIKSRKRGVALLIVSVMISVILPIVTDMNYEARTEFELAMNHKRKAEAQILAQSGVNFAVIVFDLQKQIEGVLKQFNLGQTIEIWDIVPFDTSLLRAFTMAGPMVEIEDVVSKRDGAPQGEITNEEEGDYTHAEVGDPIFQFPGDFKIEFTTEDDKINLNHLAYGSRAAVIKMLEAIVEPDFYDFIFLENTSRKEYVSRTDLIQNIVDWVDAGSEKFVDGEKYIIGGDEQSQYDGFDPAYQVKNAKFNTIMELMLVYGVNDIIYKILEPYITIYSTGKINITKAQPMMIEALIRAYAVDRSSTLFYNEDVMREFLGKILARRAKDGFAKAQDFIAACAEEGVELDKEIAKVIDVSNNVYRIRTTGIKEGIESWVEIVVDREGNMFYYREG